MKNLVYGAVLFLTFFLKPMAIENEAYSSLLASVDSDLEQNYGSINSDNSRPVKPDELDFVEVDYSHILVDQKNICSQASWCNERNKIPPLGWYGITVSIAGLIWLAIESLKYYDKHSPYDPSP